MSISVAQAEALAEGFLDGIGSSKEGLEPRESFSEFILLAGELVLDANKNLIKSRAIASGKLAESIVAEEPYLVGSILQIDITMLFYGQFVNKGVKGVGGVGDGFYQFRTLSISKSMLEAITEYIDRAKRSTRTVKKYKGYGSNEIKNKKLSKEASAYALAKAIKTKGIKPRNFMDLAIENTSKKVQSRLQTALRVDIINSLDIELE